MEYVQKLALLGSTLATHGFRTLGWAEIVMCVWHVLEATCGLSQHLEPQSFMVYYPVFIFSKWSSPIWGQNHMFPRIVFVKLWKF